MPEKPLVTSELMTCLLISSLKQSWGNAPTNPVINSLTTGFKGSVAVSSSNCVPDSGLHAPCKTSLLLSQAPPGGVEGCRQSPRQALGREVWRNSLLCGSELLCATCPGDNHSGRMGTAVVTLPHGGQPAQRKVLGLDITGCWEAEVCPSLMEGQKNHPCHQTRLRCLFFIWCAFGNCWGYSETTSFWAKGSVSNEVPRWGDAQPAVRAPRWGWFLLPILSFSSLVLEASPACPSISCLPVWSTHTPQQPEL